MTGNKLKSAAEDFSIRRRPPMHPSRPLRESLKKLVGDAGYKRVRNLYRRTIGPDAYLRRLTGVIHVGANEGQEREIYELFDLDVLWIEPIPDVFRRLQANIKPFPKQRALQYLVTDQDEGHYAFHVANNDGESSSLFEFSRHREMFPEILYSHDVAMRSLTLSTLLRKERIDLSRYQALVMDTQGSELLVLKGAADILPNFRFISAEAANFEAYQGCCKADELAAFVGKHGFVEQKRGVGFSMAGVGTYWQILYRRA